MPWSWSAGKGRPPRRRRQERDFGPIWTVEATISTFRQLGACGVLRRFRIVIKVMIRGLVSD